MTCRYRASASSLAALTSAATLSAVLPAPDVRSDTSWRSACKVKRASPITACAVGYILLMCSSSTLQWMMVFFAASGMAWLKRPGDRLVPYGEDEVAFVQVVCHLIAAHADKQRMVLRERPFGLESRDHRHIHELRQRFQVFRGARIDDPLAGVDQRVTGCQQLVNCSAHIRRVRCRFPALHRTVGVGG